MSFYTRVIDCDTRLQSMYQLNKKVLAKYNLAKVTTDMLSENKVNSFYDLGKFVATDFSFNELPTGEQDKLMTFLTTESVEKMHP